MSAKTWTAAEVERMTPSDQDALFEASIVRDLSEVDPAFLARVTERIEQRISRTETPRTN